MPQASFFDILLNVMEKYQLIIIGAGAAGLTAAIYAGRRKINTLILSMDLGGQAVTTTSIGNYPGFKLITGSELIGKMKEQVDELNIETCYDDVQSILKVEDGFEIKTHNNRYLTDSIIIASGKSPNDLNIPKESEFKGKDIHHAVTNLDEYKDKEVVVIGGAYVACQSALTLSPVAKKVTLACRTTLKAESVVVDEVKRSLNIGVIYEATPVEFMGSDCLSGLKIDNSSGELVVHCEKAIVAIGYSNKTEWLNEILELDQLGQIIIKPNCSTSCEGIFAAGDETTIPYKQVVVSAGEGAKASISASLYLANKTGSPLPKFDWEHK